MTKKQRMNRAYVACWDLYKKYHDIVPLSESQKEMLAEEATQISKEFGDTRFVKRMLHATCDEVCDEMEKE